MKTILGTFKAVIGLALLAIVVVPAANAQCVNLGKYKKSALMLPQPVWAGQLVPAAFTLAAHTEAQDSQGAQQEPIVGFWSVKFIAEGNTAASSGLPTDEVPPDGAVIDTGNQQWHSDGTEIHNSGTRPPVTQSFCLGVWKKVGPTEYKLNHFALSWNPDGTLLGPANIREDVKVSQNHNNLSGTFTIDQYDSAHNLLVHLMGQIEGKRITMATTVNDLL